MFGDLKEMTTLVREQQLQMRELIDAVKELNTNLTLLIEQTNNKQKHVEPSQVKFIESPCAKPCSQDKKGRKSRTIGEDAA